MAETTSQLQAKLLALTDGKVNIMIDENNFKNTTQILREMSAEWEHMTDVEQAAALELLGGKRQANTLSAIISNFDIVENAIEASANSAGSALEENAKVLDSIQGRINLFNNALQTMWNNTLDNNLIKDVVSLGTEIVKIADRIGLINSALIVLGAHKGFGALFKSLKEDGVTLKSIWTWVNQLTLATRQQQIADAAAVGTTLSRMNAEELLNISIVKRFATEQLDAKVKEANLTRDVVLVAAKQALALAEEQYAEGLIDDIALQTAKNAVDAASVPITTSQIGVTGVLSAMFKGLGVSIWGAVKAMAAFLFTNPVGWFILATAAVAGGVAIFNHFHKTTEELTEELSELKSELSDIRSEIDSLNSELETTQSRIAELLAKDKLSFTEQEELNNLQKQNDELQRQIDLIELKNKQKQKETAQKFNETMLSDSSDDKEYYADGSEANWISELGFMMGGAHGLSHPGYLSQSQIIDKKIEEYKEYANKLADIEQQIIDVGGEDTNKGKSLKKEKDEIDAKMSEIQTYINDKTTQWNENSEGLEYFTGDNLQDWQKQSNAWLDYINDVKDQWAIASGGTDAETNAIARIFNKEEFAEVSDNIDGLVKKLEKDPTNNGIKNQIQSIIESNSELVSNLERVGLSADKATDYFTMFASSAAFDTIKGKMEEINRASEKFEQLVNGTEFTIDGINIDLQSLFDEEGKIDQIKLSGIFTNTSDEMRRDITSILEGSYDDIQKGTVKIEDLLTKFSLRTTEQFLRVQNNFISNQNKEWFPGLEDEISGIIDTFDELATAIGSIVDAMDTLEQARKEEEYSGSVSIETLAKLMEYTDDYSKIVSIDETGAIHLAADAQNILIQEKINGIKTNAEAAVQEAKLAYQNALAAESSVKFADVIAGSTIPQLDELAGAIAYAGSILGDLEAAMADGFGGVTFSARNSMAKAETAYNSKISSRQSVRTQATSDAEEALRKAQDNLKIANGLTVDNVQSRYSSSVADGSKKDSSKDDAFQKAMDYWENRIAANQAKYEQIQNEIDLLEKQGKTAGEDYYKEQIKLENERLKLLEAQKAEAKKFLGTFKTGSDEWWTAAQQINDIESEIDSITSSILDLRDAIAQIKWDVFDESHTRFGNLKSQLETVRELVAPNNEEDWFDDEGNWTDKGVAVAGAYIQEIEIDENALEDTQKKLADFAKGYKGNEKYFKDTYGLDSEQEYYDKRQELIEQEQEYAKNINSNKQAVVDMYEAQIDAVEEYTSKLIDSYNEYIDTVKEAIDAERD